MNRSKFIFPSSKISIIFFLLNFFGNFIFLLKKMTEDDVIRGINFFDMFDLRKQSHVRIYIYISFRILLSRVYFAKDIGNALTIINSETIGSIDHYNPSIQTKDIGILIKVIIYFLSTANITRGHRSEVFDTLKKWAEKRQVPLSLEKIKRMMT